MADCSYTQVVGVTAKKIVMKWIRLDTPIGCSAHCSSVNNCSDTEPVFHSLMCWLPISHQPFLCLCNVDQLLSESEMRCFTRMWTSACLRHDTRMYKKTGGAERVWFTESSATCDPSGQRPHRWLIIATHDTNLLPHSIVAATSNTFGFFLFFMQFMCFGHCKNSSVL